MATTFTLRNMGVAAQSSSRAAEATTEGALVRWSLITVAVLFLGVFLFMPLAVVFASALAKGFSVYLAALGEPDAQAAIRLTLLAAGIAVPMNLIFGVAAAWAIGKFDFVGKNFLVTLIDLPFSVSPVVSGHIRGRTNTVPLHIEILYNEYQFAPAFAVASLLALLAWVTLFVKSFVEWKSKQHIDAVELLRTSEPLPATLSPGVKAA